MVLAYLRGFLLPNYEHGLVSVIREKVVLAALSSEVQSEVMKSQLIAQAAFAPILKPDAAKQMYERMAHAFTSLLNRSEMNLLQVPEELSKKSQAMLQLLEKLEQTGFFQRLNESSSRTLNKMGWDKIYTNGKPTPKQ